MIEDETSQLSTAKTASILGILGLTMLASMCCTSIMGIFAGTLCGLIGLWLAYTQHGQDLMPEARAYNNVALATGGISGGMGCVFTLMIAAYIGFYVLMIVFMVVLGA